MQASLRERRPSTLRHDERAVSEVVGQILTLGILSTLLITSLWGFAIAKDNATERAVAVRGDALLQRISATAVQMALFAEEHAGSSANYTGHVDLPQDLEGHQYQIDLNPDEVFLRFPSFAGNVSAPLFQAGAGVGVTVCDQDPLPGGPIDMRLREAGSLDPSHTCYDAGNTTFILYLEIAS